MSRITIAFMLVTLTSFLLERSSCAQSAAPNLKSILRTYIDAVGGEQKLRSVKTIKVTAQQITENDEGTTDSTDSLFVSTGRWVVKNSLGTQSGFDGSRHWIQIKGYSPKWQSNIRYPLNLRDPVAYPLHLLSFPGTLRLEGKTEIGKTPAWRIRARPAEEEPIELIRQTPKEFLFDANTGLLLQVVFEAKRVEFSDYRDVDGIKVPFTQISTYRFADISSKHELNIKTIEFNSEIDDRLFNAPIEGQETDTSR